MMKGFFKVIASAAMALAISACAGTAQQEIFVPEGYENRLTSATQIVQRHSYKFVA